MGGNGTTKHEMTAIVSDPVLKKLSRRPFQNNEQNEKETLHLLLHLPSIQAHFRQVRDGSFFFSFFLCFVVVADSKLWALFFLFLVFGIRGYEKKESLREKERLLLAPLIVLRPLLNNLSLTKRFCNKLLRTRLTVSPRR